YVRINSLIVRVGGGRFSHGITLWLGNQQTISGVSEGLVTAVIVTRVFGVPLGFYYALILCVVIWYVLSYTALGRRMLFVGRGREVARLSGIRVDHIRWGCLVASGMIGGMAGGVFVGATGAGDPRASRS